MVLLHDLLITSNILFNASFSSGVCRLSHSAWQERLGWGQMLSHVPQLFHTWFCCGCLDAPDQAAAPVGTAAHPAVNWGVHPSREGVPGQGLRSGVRRLCEGSSVTSLLVFPWENKHLEINLLGKGSVRPGQHRRARLCSHDPLPSRGCRSFISRVDSASLG